MALIILQFRNASIKTLENIQSVAKRILHTRYSNNEVIAVVSPMHDEQERLIKLAKGIQVMPQARELASLLAVGGQVAASLVAQSILALGGQALSFNAMQVGIYTNNEYDCARIMSINLSVILAALKNGQVPIITGCQGMTINGEFTFLDSNEEDATAKMLAAILSADKCQVYSLISEVYTDSPRLLPVVRNDEFFIAEKMNMNN